MGEGNWEKSGTCMAKISLSSFKLQGYGQDSRIFTADELCGITGLTNQRITQLVKEGMPRSGHGQYNIESVKWYIAYQRQQIEKNQSETVVSERLRLTRAKADKAEIEVAKSEGKVIEIADLNTAQMQILQALKDELFLLPAQIDVSRTEEIRGKIADALNKAAARLESLASGSSNTSDGVLQGCGALG